MVFFVFFGIVHPEDSPNIKVSYYTTYPLLIDFLKKLKLCVVALARQWKIPPVTRTQSWSNRFDQFITFNNQNIDMILKT